MRGKPAGRRPAKSKPATVRGPSASAKKNGGGAPGKSKAGSSKAPASVKINRGGAPVKRKAAAGSTSAAKGKGKKGKPVPRAKETEAEKDAREKAMEVLLAEKDKKWDALYNSRTKKQSRQGERADVRKANDDALQAELAKHLPSKTPNTGGPSTAVPGDGTKMRPAHGLDQHEGGVNSQSATLGPNGATETPPLSPGRQGRSSTYRERSDSRSGRRGGTSTYRSRSPDGDRGRHRSGSNGRGRYRSPGSSRGRHGSRPRDGGGRRKGVSRRYSRSRSRSNRRHYAGRYEDDERRYQGRYEYSRYSRSRSGSRHSRINGSRRDSRHRPHHRQRSYSRPRSYRHPSSYGHNEWYSRERSPSRQRRSLKDTPRDTRGRHRSSDRDGGGGAGGYPARSPSGDSRQHSPRQGRSRSESRLKDMGSSTGSGARQQSTDAATDPKGDVFEGDEPLAKLRAAKLEFEMSRTVGGLRRVVRAYRECSRTRTGKKLHDRLKYLNAAGIAYTTMTRWLKEFAAFEGYDNDHPIKAARKG
ncbi:expressed unknown protein [Ectocarpus siliculosus]|uniref:Uncharacterized protein n=1 Tax=Ectocarpus siliculosus TaxID=2880 RepID=D7G2S6_ECTSI|nr:expressed unknown protein [Ectocarpus siliculosus]|eukprot:CBJ33430.1 expressed unknown protein [Ectocarpus siliculosus]